MTNEIVVKKWDSVVPAFTTSHICEAHGACRVLESSQGNLGAAPHLPTQGYIEYPPGIQTYKVEERTFGTRCSVYQISDPVMALSARFYWLP